MSFACSSLAIFVAAAKAAGANLTDASWEKGLESIGSLPLPNAPVCSFGPNKPDCQDSFQLAKFNPAWKPNSSTPQYIPTGQPITHP